MKIVLGCRTYTTLRAGGMPFVAHDRAHELVRQGHEVHVITTGRGPNAEPPYEQPVFEYDRDGTEWRKGQTGVVIVHHLPGEPRGEYSRQWADNARALVAELRPEIVHVDGFDRNNPWWLNGPWRKAVTLHGFGWGGTLSKWQAFLHGRGPEPVVNFQGLKDEAAALRLFDRVITISVQEHWLASDLYGLGNVDLVYNPIAPEFFHRDLVPPPAPKSFICASISGQEMRCWDFAKSVCDEAGVEITQVRNVSRENMPALYDAHSAVLVLSLYEQGFDLTCAEAAARGRAIICNNVGSYGREAEGDKFMLVVQPFDRPALLEIIRDGNFGLVVPTAPSMHEPAAHVREWLAAVAG